LTKKGKLVFGISSKSAHLVPSRGGFINSRQCIEKENHRKQKNSTEIANNGIQI